MLDYIEFLNLPISWAIFIVASLLVLQIIGKILEVKGKAAPEIMNIRKHFARKKQERETLAQLPNTFEKVEALLDDVNGHYSSDNIAMRDKWMQGVDTRLDNSESIVAEINMKLDKNSEEIANLSHDITDLRLENKRDTIISFAEKVGNNDFPATREQFTRIDKIYQEYERIIAERGLRNGEIEIAHKIIEEAYQYRLINHGFIEDVRWHGLEQ